MRYNHFAGGGKLHLKRPLPIKLNFLIIHQLNCIDFLHEDLEVLRKKYPSRKPFNYYRDMLRIKREINVLGKLVQKLTRYQVYLCK